MHLCCRLQHPCDGAVCSCARRRLSEMAQKKTHTYKARTATRPRWGAWAGTRRTAPNTRHTKTRHWPAQDGQKGSRVMLMPQSVRAHQARPTPPQGPKVGSEAQRIQSQNRKRQEKRQARSKRRQKRQGCSGGARDKTIPRH